jgi:hypothetical protein
MRYILLICCSVFVTFACNDQDKKTEVKPALVKESKAASAGSVNTVAIADSVPKNIQVDSIIQLAFAADSISVTVKGHLDKKGDPVICYLPVVKGKKLTASVIPEKAKANIRFSHIYLPNGKLDGPFSPNMKYDLVQRGVYKIYISPNRMAGDPMSTDFILKVKVE